MEKITHDGDSEIKLDDPTTIPEMYKPIIHLITFSDKITSNITPEMSNGNDYPRLSLGFQQFLHANVKKMEIIKEFENKKKIYRTMHLFDKNINEYDSDLEKITHTYFKFDGDQKIIGNGFYKLWELLSIFNIISTNVDTFSFACIADDGSLTQSVSLYYDTFIKKGGSKDKYYILSLNNTSQIDAIMQKKLGKKLVIVSSSEDKLLLTDSTIRLFSKETGNNQVDLVMAYGAPQWKYSITLEQEMLKLIIGEIICALRILSNNGNFICRIYESFTGMMCKIMYTLSSFFKEIYLVKPLMSHMSTSEKFIVCKGYKSNPKVLEQLDKLLKIISEKHEFNVINIFPEFIIPDNYYTQIMLCNIDIANKQIISINKIVSFIKSQNYYGDLYTESRNAQIDSSKFWINLYYPKGDYNKMIKILDKIAKDIIEHNQKKIKRFL